MYLNNSAIEYDKEDLEIKNLYGGTVKKYSFHTDNIEIKNGGIYSNDSKVRDLQ